MEPVTIKHYKVLSPGTYSPSPQEIIITANDVQDYVDAVNIKEKLGVPVAIKYMHRDGVQSIAIGKQINAVREDDNAFVDLVFTMDAEFDGVVMATVDQMVSGLQDQILQGSMEAYPGYSSPAYTGKRVFGIWPTAWAVLPAGEQPAIPPKLIAGESEISLICISGAPDGGNSPIERGQEMTLEEAIKMIATLKAEIAELKKAKAEESDKDELAAKDTEIKDLKAEVKVHEDAVEAALETKANELQKTVLEKVLAANRSEAEKKLKAMDKPAERVQFLELLDITIKPIEAAGTKLGAGDDTDKEGGTEKVKIDAQKKAIYAAADTGKFDLTTIQGNEQATDIAMRDHPELFKE